MIRIKFELNEKGIRDFLANKSVWNKAKVKRDGDKILYCYADIDSNHIDDDGYDCYFYVQKPYEEWENKDIKPKLIFRGRTIIMYNKWRAQFKEYLHDWEATKSKMSEPTRKNKRKDIEDIL